MVLRKKIRKYARKKRRTKRQFKRKRVGNSRRFRKRVLRAMRSTGVVKLEANNTLDISAAYSSYLDSAACISLYRESNSAVPWNFCAMTWPDVNVPGGDDGLRANKGFFKSNIIHLAIDNRFYEDATITYAPPIGYRIIFFRPRNNVAQAGINTGRDTGANMQGLGFPNTWIGIFNPRCYQLFKILKDKNYYIAGNRY